MPESAAAWIKTAGETLRGHTVALIGVSLVLVVVLHWGTFFAMADIWLRSDTFAHGLIVGPVFLFFIFRIRHELAQIEPRPFWPGLVLLLLATTAWVAGRLVGVNAVEQFAAVAMIPITVLTVAGPAVVRATAFPLLFLFFAVPFGEFLIPQLMEITADLTEWMLILTGFSLYRDGFFIAVPGGDFEIAKACSGIRYLIASIVLGTIFAYLTYRTWRKRLIFIGFSILVPIVANGIRAYMIIVLASLSGMRLAVGVDHFIYGWVFFGIVMFLLFGIGVRFRDDEVEDTPATVTRTRSSAQRRSDLTMLVLALAVMLVGPVSSFAVQTRAAQSLDVRLATVPSGWQPVSSSSPWQPAFQPSDQSLRRAVTNGSATIYEFVDVYNSADGGVDAASSVNRLVDNKTWRIAEVLPVSDKGMRLVRVKYGRQEMFVASWYQNGDQRTTSALRSKLAEARDTLFHGGRPAAVVAFAIDATDENVDRLRRYLADYTPAFSRCLGSPDQSPHCSG